MISYMQSLFLEFQKTLISCTFFFSSKLNPWILAPVINQSLESIPTKVLLTWVDKKGQYLLTVFSLFKEITYFLISTLSCFVDEGMNGYVTHHSFSGCTDIRNNNSIDEGIGLVFFNPSIYAYLCFVRTDPNICYCIPTCIFSYFQT